NTTDLSVHARDIHFTPAGADVGESIHIAATVLNRGSFDATAVVEWWQGRPSFQEGGRLGTTPIRVLAAGSATAEFDWVRREGIPEVFAKVAQVVPRDSAPQNNKAGRHLFLETIVNLGLSDPFGGVSGKHVRFGRLTGRADPELVVGWSGG